MTTIRHGFYIELQNRSTQRVIFSAATSEVDQRTFEELWLTVWRGIFAGLGSDKTGGVSN